MTDDNGGPAFPAPAQPKTNLRMEDVTSGMSLRDWFAGQAAGDLAVHCIETLDEEPEAVMAGAAKAAYMLADAMLAARAALSKAGRTE